ncbi:MAG: division/cell wall cluster transcriptional repressor MraZ [Bacteroidaceae bacterium]|nr:division/cell wall cluster transcriptional repressor MraZ [Bacteroidaceae bacterium]
MRFIGDYIAKTDAKGRVFLPAALRKALEAEGCTNLVLRKDVFQSCLALYPMAVWEAMVDELDERLSRWNGAHQQVKRQFVADAEPIELDSNGRILLNKRKMEFAHITTDVRFLAVDDHIEIWDRQTLEQLLEQSEDKLGGDIQSLMGGAL